MYTVYPNRTGRNTSALSEEHRRMLYDESGISPEVAAERGYSSTPRGELPTAFKSYQRRTGLLIPLHSPDGITRSHQNRPENPRRDRKGKRIKYETAGGSRAILDVHPRMRENVRAGVGDLWITEGVKKADSLTSRGSPPWASSGCGTGRGAASSSPAGITSGWRAGASTSYTTTT